MSSLQDQKNALFPLLQTAFELELSTIPPYLTAMLSLRPEANRTSANIIRSVMMEEMLHMTLVGNLISSLGGKVKMNADTVPTYPLTLEFQGQTFKDREFDVNLMAFSEEALHIFMQIEMPTDWVTEDKQLKAVAEIDVPGITIGAFYEMIEEKLEDMCAAYPETEVFSGDSSKQIDENYYWAGGGKPVIITSLDSAKEAIQVIVDQGEGADGSLADGDQHYFDQPLEVAHFFRFREIAFGRYYQQGDQPKEPPTGEQFDVNYQAVFPIITNASDDAYQNDSHMTELNQSFNRNYSLMLHQIAQAFNGTPEALYTAIVNGMHNLTPIALEMMNTPIVDDQQGRHGAPSFSWIQPL